MRLGYTGSTEDSQLLLSFLQTVRADHILAAQLMFADWDHVSPLPWVAIPDSFCSNPIMPLSFQDAVKRGELEKMPVMQGLCRDDGMILTAPFFRSPDRWDALRQDWESLAPLIYLGRERDLVTDRDRALAKEIATFYFGEVLERILGFIRIF